MKNVDKKLIAFINGENEVRERRREQEKGGIYCGFAGSQVEPQARRYNDRTMNCRR